MGRLGRIAALVSVTALVTCICLSIGPAGAASHKATKAPSAPFSITTSPAIVPSFSAGISDYVVPCTDSPTTNLTTTGTGKVKIGSTRVTGPVNVNLTLVAGQEVTVTSAGNSYYIRCLPSDFPAYTSTVTGTPQASGYLATLPNYAIIFDNEGVPVWWYKDASNEVSPWDAKFLTPTTISWNEFDNTYVVRGLNGALKATLGGPSLPLDVHDLQLMPNGDYLGIEDVTTNCPAVPSQCVDLSSWGLSPQSSVLDTVIVEFTKKDKVVWSWDPLQHLDVAAENVNWRAQYPDVIHMNSIQYDGNGGIIFSARHLDAVYRIDMATGAITWKLGGTQTAQSLTVSGDQYLDSGGQLFSGQHYARILPDGSITVQDNGSLANRLPRALQFTIDTTAMSATEVEQITDPRAATSFCCGSAIKLPGGDWVVDWGAGDYFSELNAEGVPQLTVSWPQFFSYRVELNEAPLSALRNGMNAMVAPLATP